MGRELEREARGEEPVEDTTRAGFWNQLADQLRETTVLGRAGDWADDAGDDFDYEPDSEYEAREAALRRAVKKHPLTTLATTYMRKAHKWLETSDDDLKEVARELLDAAGRPLITFKC